LWKVASAHNHLRQGGIAIAFLEEYIRLCDILEESWEEEGLGPDRVNHLKERVRSRIEEVRDDMERSGDEDVEKRPGKTPSDEPEPSELQSELPRLRKELEHKVQHIIEQENLLHEQKELIRKKEERFAEQVDLLHRQYERMNEKEEKIRRLEADAIILKNAKEKSDKDHQKELLRLPPTFKFYRPTGSRSSGASTGSKASTRSFNSRRLSDSPTSLLAPASHTTSAQTPVASNEESFLGIPLLGMYLASRTYRDTTNCEFCSSCSQRISVKTGGFKEHHSSKHEQCS
jgi:hypothetical protein